VTIERLCEARLAGLQHLARLPAYRRERVGVGQLHLGIGAFHRAHQAIYTDELLNRAGGNWGICGASLRSPATRDRLAPQDLLYSVTERSTGGSATRIIGALREMIVAPENPSALIRRFADPAIKVVTLTITEKGYGLDPATGEVDLGAAELTRDLGQPHNPCTALGYLAAGLHARRKSGGDGVTLLSCDNLAGNGNKLRAALLQYAGVAWPGLEDWIANRCAFPCSMVDRIVPATTTRDIRDISRDLGVEDRAAVITEPFSQWVIESRFAGPVPAWDRVGAHFVADVAAYETMKLRLLNASHSCLAYLGCIAGWETVAEAVAAPGVRALLDQLMRDEMAPTLSGLRDFDTNAYCDSLLERFANRGLAHRTAQIAIDGSQKVAQRLLPPLRERLARGEPIDAISLALAAWLRYVAGAADDGQTLTIEDPMAHRLAGIVGAHRHDTGGYVDAMLGLKDLFDAELAGSVRLREALLHWLDALAFSGAASLVAQCWGDPLR
jgi:fructuronate reductase